MNPRPIKLMSDGIAWRWSILFYCSFFIIPSIFLSWPTPAWLKQPQTITEPPQYFIVGTIQSGLNLSLTFLRTYWRRWFPKSSNFDSSAHKTDFHWSIVQSTCSWANFSLFCLFTGRRSGFLTAMRPIIPFSLNRPLTVESDIGESKSSLISTWISDADFCRLPLLIAYILLSIPWFVFLGLSWTQRYFQYFGYFSIVFACFLENNDLDPFLDRYFLLIDHLQSVKIQYWGYFNEKAGTIMHKRNDCQIKRLTVFYDTSMHQTR